MRRALVLAAATTAACVTPPNAAVRSTYETMDVGNTTNDTWSNQGELGVRGELGPGFDFRVSDRIVREDTRISSATGNARMESTLNQSTVDTSLAVGALRWTQGLDLQTTETSTVGGFANDLQRSGIVEKIEWTPLGLPQVTAWIDYQDNEADLFTDREDVETVLQVEQRRGAFSYFYSYEAQDTRDLGSAIRRTRDTQLFRGTFSERFLEDRVTTTFSVFATDRDDVTRVAAGGAAAVLVAPIAGLSDLDTSPQIAVLQDTPGLIDGDDTTSAGINIGGFASGGELNWNFGLELPLGSEIDRLELFTVDAIDVLLVNDFSFSVWASSDNNFWTLVTATAAYTYDPLLRRFRLSIPSVTERYVKVVNTSSPATAPAVLVSELEASFSGPAVGVATESSTELDTRSANGNVSWRVTDDLRLTYDFQVQAFEQDTGPTSTRDEFRVDNGLSALWTPRTDVDLAVRLQNQRSDERVLASQETTLLSSLVTYQALDTLELDMGYSQSQRDVNGASDLDTQGLQFGASAQLLRGLQGDLRLEFNRQENATAGFDVDRGIVTGSLNAEVTSHVDVTLGMRTENAAVSGPAAATIPDPSEDRYEFVVLYRPSLQLTAEAQLDWVESFLGSGLDQRFRIDWLPFPGGSIDLQLDYDRITGGFTGQTIDRYQVLTRWNWNPSTYMEFNWSAQVREDGQRSDLAAVTFNFFI